MSDLYNSKWIQWYGTPPPTVSADTSKYDVKAKNVVKSKKEERIENCPFCGKVDSVGMCIQTIDVQDKKAYNMSEDVIMEKAFVRCSTCEAQGPAITSIHNIKDDVTIEETNAAWDLWEKRAS